MRTISLVYGTILLAALPSAALGQGIVGELGLGTRVAPSSSLDAVSERDAVFAAVLGLAAPVPLGVDGFDEVRGQLRVHLGGTSAQDFQEIEGTFEYQAFHLGLTGERHLGRLRGLARVEAGVTRGALELATLGSSVEDVAWAPSAYVGAGLAANLGNRGLIDLSLELELGFHAVAGLSFSAKRDGGAGHLPTDAADLGTLRASGPAARLGLSARF